MQTSTVDLVLVDEKYVIGFQFPVIAERQIVIIPLEATRQLAKPVVQSAG
jgi:hypothetical protein